MKETKLSRTGKRPVVFVGEEIAEATTRNHNSTRWTKVSVYRTDKGKFVVGIGYVTCWQGESDRYIADVFDSAEQVVTHCEEHAEPLAAEIASTLNVAERL